MAVLLDDDSSRLRAGGNRRPSREFIHSPSLVAQFPHFSSFHFVSRQYPASVLLIKYRISTQSCVFTTNIE